MVFACRGFFAIAWMVFLTVCCAVAAVGDEAGIRAASEPSPEPKLDVAYIRTPQHVVDLMLHLARVQEGELLFDLGCGDGRIVVAAAQRYGCRAVGVDIDQDRVTESQQNVREAGLEASVTIRRQDVFDVDLSEADVVTMYLTEDINVQLIPQLEQMKPGSRIVSHAWDMRGIEPTTVVSISKPPYEEVNVYLWEIPLKRVSVEEAPAEVGEEDSNAFDDAWAFALRHRYQRVLLLLVIASLGLAAFLGTAQARRRDRVTPRSDEAERR